MDAVIAIFKQLGVDHTIVTQFALAFSVFILLKHMLFDKLLEVLQTREGKTTKLEIDAKNKTHEAEKYLAEYNAKMLEINQKADKILSDKVNKANEHEKNRLLTEEKKVTAEQEQKLSQIKKELEQERKEIHGQSELLSKQLLNKLVK